MIHFARNRSAIMAHKEENDSTANLKGSIEGGIRGRLIDRELIKRRRRNDARSPRSISGPFHEPALSFP